MKKVAIAGLSVAVIAGGLVFVAPPAQASGWVWCLTTPSTTYCDLEDGSALGDGVFTGNRVTTNLWLGSAYNFAVRWYGYQPGTGQLGYSSWSYPLGGSLSVTQYHNGYGSQGNHKMDGV
jgi:hypothetical protein